MFAIQRKNKIFMEIITCNPSIYTLNHPDLTVSIFMEQSNGLKRVNTLYLFVFQKNIQQYVDLEWNQCTGGTISLCGC